jgi:hypothetical protein
MKFNQRVTLEYDKERYETTDRENDIRTNIEAMGKQLIQLAKNIKDNGELLRKYELAHLDITKIFRVHGMSSISQADIIEHGVNPFNPACHLRDAIQNAKNRCRDRKG